MLLNNHNAVASPFQSMSPTAYDTPNGTDPTSPSSGDSSTSTATITANDFLQLLVTELQNQDPTANTDPNEYVDQLVQVNSLQQLISINTDLTPASTPATGTGDVAGAGATADTATGTTGGSTSADSSTPGSSSSGDAKTAARVQHASTVGSHLHPSEHAGNLSANVDTQSSMAASANRVASSLLPRRQERVTSPGTAAVTSGRFSAH